jgi:hypothetical protein
VYEGEISSDTAAGDVGVDKRKVPQIVNQIGLGELVVEKPQLRLFGRRQCSKRIDEVAEIDRPADPFFGGEHFEADDQWL